MAESSELSPKQEAFLTAYLACSNVVTASKTAGISERTARRLIKEPAFQSALKAAQKDLFDQELAGLREHISTAISTLVRHMTAEETPPAAQIRAAQLYLEQAIQLHKMSELEEKYEELERLVKEQGR